MEVLEWIGIVIAAGFVGYFGRYAAKLLIGRFEQKQSQDTPPASLSPDDSSAEKARFKREKKRAKQAAKQAKKS